MKDENWVQYKNVFFYVQSEGDAEKAKALEKVTQHYHLEPMNTNALLKKMCR